MKQITQTVVAAAMLAGVFVVVGCGGGSMQQTAATPTFTPPAGSYQTSQQVTVGDTTEGAVLYCSIDGSAPTSASAQCSEPMTVSKSETLKAIAIAPGMSSSVVASAAYSIQETPAPAPTFTPNSGSFTAAQTVAISDALSGASIYYTTDGSAPTTNSTIYTGPIVVSSSEAISAIATASGYGPSGVAVATYTITLPTAQPIFSEAAGTYASVQTVTMTDPMTNAVIYYTTNGTQPTTLSTKYSGAITVSQTETINAIAVAPNYTASAVTSATYVISLPPTATPTFSPAAGLYASAQTVNISDATPGATIYYTTNGSPATTASAVYSAAIPVSTTETLNAIAVAPTYSASQDATAVYTINPPAQPPTFSPGSGTYTTVPTVTISDTTPGATIYYTTNGSPATNASTVYAGGIPVSTTETINAIATAPNYSASTDVSASYTVNLPAAASPAISPAGGSYSASQVPVIVTITDATAGATIYYTTDGSTPTTSSTQYAGSISVTKTETITAIAAKYNYANSTPAVAVFTVNLAQAATPTFSEGTGTYSSAQTITLSDTTKGATIYYTTDGTPATTSSTPYTVAITVSQTETINAIASAPWYNNSNDAQATYTLAQTPAPTPTFTPSPGVYSTTQSVTISDSATSPTIYYTTDGSPATTSSKVYSGAISVSSTETINAVATANGYGVSADAAAEYTISTGPAISGGVSSGLLPIVGATVQVYAAGTSGYGSATTAVTVPTGGVTTNASGQFSLGYTCPAAPGDQLYLVATGGAIGTLGANSSIALMTALGSCNSKSFPTSVTVNEVTTIASVYALGGFSKMASSGGISVGAPAPGVSCTTGGVTTEGGSTCNYLGLANAFRTVGNLVNATTAMDAFGTAAGTARTVTPFYSGADPRNPNGWSSTYGDPKGPNQIASTDNPVPDPTLNTSTVPQARINALADMLASCVETDGSGCAGGLFSAATPTGGTTPVDTLQAALNIAQNPGGNGISVATLMGLVPSSKPPYPTTLSSAAAPDDLTLALTYTGGGLGIDPSVDYNDAITNYGLAIDVAGNLWVGASPYSPSSSWGGGQGLIAGFDPLGEALTPPTSTPGGAVYQDPDTEYTTFGGYGPDVLSRVVGDNKIPGQFLLPSVMAVDPSGHLWINDNGYSVSGDSIYQGAELTISPTAAPGTTTSLSPVMWGVAATDTSMAIDGSGEVWFTLTNGGGIYGNTSSLSLIGPYSVNSTNQCGIDIDSVGLLWVTDCGASNQAFAVNASSGNTVATINGVGGGAGIESGVGGGSVGMLASGTSGNVYACNADQTGYVVLNATGSSTAPVSSFSTSNGRCGSYLTLDGAGHLWSFASVGSSPNVTYAIDEVNPNGSGSQITPDSGYTGTSSGEVAATGLTTINGAAYPPPGMAIDASGNLWFLNASLNDDTGSTPGNALVEFIGVAAPTVTPASVGVANSAQGTRP